MRKLSQGEHMQTTGLSSAGERKAQGVDEAAASNRARKIRQYEIAGGLAETWAMVELGTRRTYRKSIEEVCDDF